MTKFQELLKKYLKHEKDPEDIYGDGDGLIKWAPTGETVVYCRRSEPEDAVWYRDIGDIFYKGVELGLRIADAEKTNT